MANLTGIVEVVGTQSFIVRFLNGLRGIGFLAANTTQQEVQLDDWLRCEVIPHDQVLKA